MGNINLLRQKVPRIKSQATIINCIVAFLFLVVIFATGFLSAYGTVANIAGVFGKDASESSDKMEYVRAQAVSLLVNPTLVLAPKGAIIKWCNSVKVDYLKYTEINNVVIGKQGWFYIDDNSSMLNYQGRLTYSDNELSSIKNTIESQQEWLSKRGIPLLIVVVPNKETIYPEFMPDNIKKVKELTRLDQLVDYLGKHSKTEILDLRDVLQKNKGNYQLYYKDDSHWTGYGAYLGYVEILKKMSLYFPEVAPLPLSDFSVTSTPSKSQLSALIGLSDRYPEQCLEFSYSGEAEGRYQLYKIPSVMIYHDSFFEYLRPFISNHYDKAIEYPVAAFPYPFDQAAIETLKPDIVMYIIVERYIR